MTRASLRRPFRGKASAVIPICRRPNVRKGAAGMTMLRCVCILFTAVLPLFCRISSITTTKEGDSVYFLTKAALRNNSVSVPDTAVYELSGGQITLVAIPPASSVGLGGYDRVLVSNDNGRLAVSRTIERCGLTTCTRPHLGEILDRRSGDTIYSGNGGVQISRNGRFALFLPLGFEFTGVPLTGQGIFAIDLETRERRVFSTPFISGQWSGRQAIGDDGRVIYDGLSSSPPGGCIVHGRLSGRGLRFLSGPQRWQ